MRTTSTLLFALGTFAGCAASTPKGGGDGTGGGDGSNVGPGGAPLSIAGKYRMQSTYDLQANMPGTAGAVVRGFVDATDDPNDPSKWILDQMIKHLPSSWQGPATSAEPYAAGYLNDRLLQFAPNLVTNLLDFGNKFDQIAKGFGTLDELDVAADGTAVHLVNGVHFKVDGSELDFAFQDSHIPNVSVAGVMVTIDNTGTLAIASHKVPLQYGAIIHLGVDNVIIPMVDPNATDFGGALHDWIDCATVGQDTYDAMGFGSPGLYQAACDAGLTAVAHEIYHLIDGIDASALELDEAGTAKAVQKSGSGQVDALQTGKWSGSIVYSGTPAPMATATFSGTRM